MSKKTKRQYRAAAASAPAAAASVPSNGKSSERSDFNPDYSYVIKDLRRIGILAGSFFVVLVALAMIMPMVLH